MDLTVTKTDFGAEDRTWLGSAHGTDATRSITLEPAEFLTRWADGEVPSGVILAEETSTGLYVPYDPAFDSDPVTAGIQPDGHDVAVGILYSHTKVVAGRKHGAALFEHGRVIEANLPANHGLDADAKADLDGQIIFV